MPRVIVVGGGTMGLAGAWALARAGAEVVVLERFEHLHGRGSHGGHTRIIRESYHEGAGYIPLVRRAARLWDELSERTGERLLVRTGMVEFGAPGDPGYDAVVAACAQSGVVHELLTAGDAMRRWPFVVPGDWAACHTPAAGYLRVAACLDALRREAEAAGARLVLIGGAGLASEEARDDDVYGIPAVAHQALFPRLSANVHHGGAGTSASAFAAGVPAVVVPFGADQPFWAKQAHDLGVAPAPIPMRKLTEAALATAIGAALTDESMRRRAAELGARLAAEDGARAAAAWYGTLDL